MVNMRIGGIVDISTVDWAGNVSFVIFFAGCNFDCPYCHNSQLIPLDSGREITLDEIEERLKSGLKLLDAVVVSGGEPTMQPEALESVLRLTKKYGLKTMIQTNGSQPHIIDRLLNKDLLDHVALDLKTTPEKYHLVKGFPPLHTLIVLQRHGASFEIRTTLAPEVVTKEDLEIMKTLIPENCTWVHQEVRSKRDWPELLVEVPDWDDDRYDVPFQAYQSVNHATEYWTDYYKFYSESFEINEPQAKMYEEGLEINEDAKHDVDRLADLLEQHDKSMKKEFKFDRSQAIFLLIAGTLLGAIISLIISLMPL